MHEPSPTQKAYLARQKRDRRLVVSARLLVFLIFLAQWEILARAGWIDSFIFSSPSMIFKTFVEMAKNHSLFIHIGATLKETLLSFLFVVVLGLGISILLWGCPRLAKVLEPYLVVLNSFPSLPWPPSHCMAGCPSADHHCCRYVCGNFWIDSEPVYRLRGDQPGKAEADPHTWRR